MQPHLILQSILNSRLELRFIASSVVIHTAPLAAAPFVVTDRDRITIAPRTVDAAHAPVLIRHAIELARLRAICRSKAVCGLLAARVALRYAHHGRGEALDPVLLRVAQLGQDDVPHAQLAQCWSQLRHLQSDSMYEELGAADSELIETAWPLAGPAEALLCVGGDERIRVSPDTGRNKYGGTTRPVADSIELGSCTASTVSERGYAAAESMRWRMLKAALSRALSLQCAAEAAAIREGLLHHCGLDESTDAVLAASGTDAALVAALLARAGNPGQPCTAVLLSPPETGRGMPNALTGCAFGESTALGQRQQQGRLITGVESVTAVECVALRHRGDPRDGKDIDAEVEQRVLDSIKAGRKVLLHAQHVSKSGLIAPSRRLIMRLLRDCQPHLDVVVDACQARIDRSDVQAYVRAGATVLLTGSKFFAGPPFSGVVFAPRSKIQAALEGLPAGLSEYSSRADWRQAPPGIRHACNVGLLLRWAAAMEEMTAFFSVPCQLQTELLTIFGEVTRAAIAHTPQLGQVAGCAKTDEMSGGWSAVASIFAFTLRWPSAPERAISMPELERVYRAFNERASGFASDSGKLVSHCRIGQPVCTDGSEVCPPVAILRIAASSRHVTDFSGAALGFSEWVDRLECEIHTALNLIKTVVKSTSGEDPPLLRAEPATQDR